MAEIEQVWIDELADPTFAQAVDECAAVLRLQRELQATQLELAHARTILVHAAGGTIRVTPSMVHELPTLECRLDYDPTTGDYVYSTREKRRKSA